MFFGEELSDKLALWCIYIHVTKGSLVFFISIISYLLVVLIINLNFKVQTPSSHCSFELWSADGDENAVGPDKLACLSSLLDGTFLVTTLLRSL